MHFKKFKKIGDNYLKNIQCSEITVWRMWRKEAVEIGRKEIRRTELKFTCPCSTSNKACIVLFGLLGPQISHLQNGENNTSQGCYEAEVRLYMWKGFEI